MAMLAANFKKKYQVRSHEATREGRYVNQTRSATAQP